MRDDTATASRRDILAKSAYTVILSIFSSAPVWAGGRPQVMAGWARALVGLKDQLRSGTITVSQWQLAVESLNRSVPLKELISYLDLDRITAAFKYPSRLADIADPLLPAEVTGSAGMHHWFIRTFGMRRGGAIIPHVHNNMVSAHLVISGAFHARTHDRVRDLDGAVLLRPRMDQKIDLGDAISMSDQHHNQHWLVAQQDRSITFDVGVVGLPASWSYGLKANGNNMIFVDPDRRPERDGNIIAPVISFEQACAKFAS